MRAVFSDGIVSGVGWDLITEACVGLSLSAEPLNPLLSKHFRHLRGSPVLASWLTKRLEKRLQTIVSTRLVNLYKSSSRRLKTPPYTFTYILWHMR